MIARIEAGGYQAGIEGMIPGFLHPARANDAELRRVIHQMADDIGPEALARQLTAIMGRSDSRATLAAITCPTLVLSGDQDNTLSNTLSVEIADGITGAKLVIIPECGHLSQIERPEAVTEALLDWLAN
jgi:pimeloyl-ACP methyl ester carboxylesterase